MMARPDCASAPGKNAPVKKPLLAACGFWWPELDPDPDPDPDSDPDPDPDGSDRWARCAMPYSGRPVVDVGGLCRGLTAVETPRWYGRVIMAASQLWPYRSRVPAVSQSDYSRAVGGDRVGMAGRCADV